MHVLHSIANSTVAKPTADCLESVCGRMWLLFPIEELLTWLLLFKSCCSRYLLVRMPLNSAPRAPTSRWQCSFCICICLYLALIPFLTFVSASEMPRCAELQSSSAWTNVSRRGMQIAAGTGRLPIPRTSAVSSSHSSHARWLKIFRNSYWNSKSISRMECSWTLLGPSTTWTIDLPEALGSNFSYK